MGWGGKVVGIEKWRPTKNSYSSTTERKINYTIEVIKVWRDIILRGLDVQDSCIITKSRRSPIFLDSTETNSSNSLDPALSTLTLK